jgi:hypothetical protein
MASAEVVFLEQARRARDRAARLRTIARGINAPDVLEQIEALALDLEDNADLLEKSAAVLARSVVRTDDLGREVRAIIDQSKELVRRLRQRLGDPAK